ncbi:porin family protein [Rasiella sp. SM2506]|uniref:porin family protein n=1 Tax=Rasiella sp. SM2506 TaxID=3423914 RepID=UPI003D7B9D39
MKTPFAFLFFLLFVALSGYSQDKGDFTFSIYAGGGISNISSVDEQNLAEARLGLTAGVYGAYYFSEKWSVRTNVGYLQYGWTNGVFVTDSGMVLVDRNYGLHYIIIGTAPNFHFGSNKNKNWYLNLGPYVGFLAGANANRTQVKRFFKTTDIGVTGGIGYKIPLGKKATNALFFELVAHNGLTNIFEENEGGRVTNHKFGLHLGYTF